MRLQITIAVLGVLSTPSLYSQPPTHGTINILLANRNGIVLVTDSRASDQLGHRVNDSSQKLFQIDSVTVCSIAGFGADQGPHRAIRETAGGVISSVAEGLAQSNAKLSFQQKISVLTSQLSARLEALETDYEYAEKSLPARPQSRDELIMLFAGFDVDGSAVIAKVDISVRAIPLANSKVKFLGEVTDLKIEPVGRSFVYLTSGVDDSAQYRLKSPKAFGNENELKEYGQAVHDGHTADLSLDQLDRLARYLEFDASRSASVIGGPPQVATLADKQVQVRLPENLIVDPKPYVTGFMTDVRMMNSPIFPLFRIGPHTALVNDYCEQSAVILDGLIIIGGRYANCNFYFDGGDFYRDPTVVVDGGRLILGPHVSMTSYFIEKARKSMPELAPMSYKDLPNAELVLKQIWPDN